MKRRKFTLARFSHHLGAEASGLEGTQVERSAIILYRHSPVAVRCYSHHKRSISSCQL